MNIKEKIDDLVKELTKYSYDYYVLDNPTISDAEYDTLYNELKRLELETNYINLNSPTQKIIASKTSQFKKVKHREQMLSLSNVYSFSEFKDFAVKVHEDLKKENLEYVLEPKIDGLSLSVRYLNGSLILALTRGDGFDGEDVTENAKKIKNLPLSLNGDYPDDLEIRGEVVLPKKMFSILQKDLSSANPRNLASGTMRQKDSSVVANRGLIFIAHSFVYPKNYTDNYSDSMLKLKDWGISISEYFKIIKNLDEVNKYYLELLEMRDALPYEIDGLVIKLNSYRYHNILGNIAKAPKWAIAWKPPAQIAKTKVKNIVFQVGRTGHITPVADLESVNLGVLIQRATLHNIGELKRLDINIGDTVVLERAGDVIPHILRVETKSNKQNIEIPTNCPSCGQNLVYKDELLFCTNYFCYDRMVERIKHFTSKGAMNIIGMGDKIVEQLVKKGLVKKFSDIYNLDIFDMMRLDKIAEKSASNLLNSIANSKKIEFYRFIYALGIDTIGKEASKDLAKNFKDLKTMKLLLDNKEKLNLLLDKIKGFGPIMANNILSFFANKENKEEFLKLIDAGIEVFVNKQENALSGLSFVITGVFNVNRDFIKELIENNGGKVLSAVSKNTSYIIVGEKAGSKKEKARNLNIKELNYDEFLLLLNNEGE